ncbi:MAG: isochorismatase family cysteine hydrolase [Synergistaceae bacterium]|nr:isochorismatase family cysteine hydrolase [Synergistaceae bacterium]
MDGKVEFMIVVDMQNDFVSGSLGSEMARAIVPEVAAAVEGFVSSGGAKRLIFTKDIHEENYPDTNEGRHLPVPHCLRGTPGAEIIPELCGYASREATAVVEKPAFGSVELPGVVRARIAAYEKENGAPVADKDIVFHIMGLCTDICVVSNALLLKAHFPEADFKVDSRRCAGVTPESHRAALETMKMCHIEIS